MIGGQLNTQRLQLARLTPHDVALVHKLNSFAQVARYNTIGIPKDIEVTKELCANVIAQLRDDNPLTYAWIIREKDSGDFVGQIGLNLSAARYKKGEVFFSLLPECWGQGYAREAANAVLKFGFESLDLHRIEAGVAVPNEKSIALIERLGMQREGRHRKILPLAMGFTDNYSYAILKEDWDAYTPN
jgi:RimJ/RimL family protein N-acetyltransferase